MSRILSVVAAGLLAGLFVVPVSAGEDPPVIVKLGGGVAQRQPLLVPGGAGQPAGQPTPGASDEDILTKAGLSATDGAKLLEYLRQRTLSDLDQSKISGIIQRFGADDFEDRVKATEEIEAYGPAAVGPLKAAERDSDPEVVFRAKLVLKRMEKVPHSSVAAAAVRALAKLKPDGAAAALIGFLPVADTDIVAQAIRESLVALAVGKDGKAEPALVAALADASVLRRSAAYVALAEGGPATERIRIKDAYPQLKAAILKEADTEAKFAGLWSLAVTTREKEYVPELLNLVPQLGRGRIWQLEELLLQLAGSHPKDGRFLKTPEALGKARDAWLAWWKEKGDKVDFVAFDFKPRVQGITDIIEMDVRGYNQSRIVSLGPDLKEKWRLTGLNNPTDLKVMPNGRMWIVESNNNLITEREPNGTTVLTRRNIGQQPMNIDLLPNGGMVVVCRNNIVELDKDGKQVWAHARNNYDVMAGRRLPNGETLFVTNLYQQPNVPAQQNGFRLDAKGQEVVEPKPKDGEAKKPLTFGYVYQLQRMEIVGESNVLICERENRINGQTDRVAEYDLKTGKLVWKYDCPPNSGPSSAQRLPNGNTLICLMNTQPGGRVIEVDPSNEIVWEYQSKDGLRAARAFRR
jgi:hypothetical protein